VRILHSLECLFDVMLAPVSTNDLFIAPGLLVGEEDVLPQQCALKTIPTGLIHAVAQVRDLFLTGHNHENEVLHMTPRIASAGSA